MKDIWIPRITSRTVIRLTITTFRIRTIVSYNRWQCTTNVTAFPRSIFFGGMLRRCSTISAYMCPTILKEISKVKQVKQFCVMCVYLSVPVSWVLVRCDECSVQRNHQSLWLLRHGSTYWNPMISAFAHLRITHCLHHHHQTPKIA